MFLSWKVPEVGTTKGAKDTKEDRPRPSLLGDGFQSHGRQNESGLAVNSRFDSRENFPTQRRLTRPIRIASFAPTLSMIEKHLARIVNELKLQPRQVAATAVLLEE